MLARLSLVVSPRHVDLLTQGREQHLDECLRRSDQVLTGLFAELDHLGRATAQDFQGFPRTLLGVSRERGGKLAQHLAGVSQLAVPFPASYLVERRAGSAVLDFRILNRRGGRNGYRTCVTQNPTH